ncbi:Uncharacterised protein [Sphingobacterium spiritivorum]|uniref:Uncharacterized protein n=1 Tax=Sphingobacterium spiritivorum TaxID=258 RepID=A0A380CSD1_SPHSI|nr:hypothetical protein [Sphingobacterium spiritivorum]SUJ26443.1 Uncharacterised protein [Sphingobacterium spiritivorum]
MAANSDKKYLELWQQYKDNISKATPIDLFETPVEKQKRIERLEKNPEEWFKYYFPNFYTCEPAPWHISATKRVLNNPEWYEVRSWARGLSKSGRTMMEVLYLALTGQKQNIVLVSATFDAACRLLLPYKSILESNNRIINDYGIQQSLGNWEAGEFITRKGVAFRALGAGQSPRGTRNDAIRPDTILIDDIDTDEECRNEDRIKQKIKWIEEALIPTRDISRPLLILASGNIIAQFCCITEMAKKADKHDIVNIRDENGKSTWPQKNSEAHIDRVLSQISENAAQKEYFNNPIIEGDTFEAVTYINAPKISTCDMVVLYLDPSTSNKDKKKTGGKSQASYKSAIIVGYKAFKYYTYWIRLEQTNNKDFIDWIYQGEEYLTRQGVDPKVLYIENNSLQDPFYQQVIKPSLYKKAEDEQINVPSLREDTRKKPEKYDRIEGTLQPIDKAGNLLFDKKLEGDKHMKKMESQMLAVSPNAKYMDGPDALEGAVWIIQNRKVRKATTYRVGNKANRRF